MRHESRDPALLWDMLERSRRVQRYVAGVTCEGYLADTKLQDAVERCIELIGEAARGITDQFKEQHTEIRWKPIQAQRHILAHEYGEVLPDRIYRVATVYIPALIAALAPLLPPEPRTQ